MSFTSAQIDDATADFMGRASEDRCLRARLVAQQQKYVDVRNALIELEAKFEKSQSEVHQWRARALESASVLSQLDEAEHVCSTRFVR